MRLIDRLLQDWRARMARPWIRPGDRLLDIGCHQGEFLASLGDRIGPSVGYDPLTTAVNGKNYRLIAQIFREPTGLEQESFDAVVMLATLEHVRDKGPLGRECFRVLRPGGRLILTVPSPAIDNIIRFFRKLRLADGMSLEEHHDYDPWITPRVFSSHGFELEHHRRFQLGLNHLFVLRKPTPAVAGR